VSEAPLDPQRIFSALHESGVRYLLIGGQAAVLHGVPRATFDVDVFVEGSPANLQRLRRALEALDAEETSRLPDDVFGDRQIVMFGDAPRLDMFLQVAGVPSFAFAQRTARRFRVADVPVRALSLKHLIASKRAAHGPKDLADIEALNLLRPPKRARRR
jgi:hypothetical protein